MSTISPDSWEAVGAYLDQALSLPEEKRAAWVASLREQDPALASRLESLLREHHVLAHEHFLEQGPPPALSPQAVMAGQKIGPYVLVSPIGEGGMGSVWLAERSDGRFRRRAAVKFLRVPLLGRAGEERFKREGTILARLSHPHIAQLLDAGVSPTGQPYLILEHIDGEDIVQHCDRRRLAVEGRVRLFLDVLAAVAHAHAHLIVHRDIKPSNVLVAADGQVKLLDFGIAKLLENEGGTGPATLLTREGGGALTPLYAAPEQVTGGPVTTATDVYAAGVLLYVLLTGQHPAGPGPHSPADLVKAIVETEPPRLGDAVGSPRTGAEVASAIATQRATTPDKLRRTLRGDLDTIVAKALKKNPQERYASAGALADDLRRYLENQPISARPDSLTYRTAKFVRRNRMAVVLATLAFVGTLAGVVGTLMQARMARKQRDFAFRQLARTEATNEFNNFLLSDAAPSGKPFTVNELLGRAERIIRLQHATSDADRVDLMTSIGLQYSIQEQDAKAQRILEEAYRLSRGVSDPSVRADASCSLASELSRAGELQRAESLIQEGLRELPDAPEFAIARVNCLRRGSEVAEERGNPPEGIARLELARRVLSQSPFDSDWGELLTLMNLGEAYRIAGHNSEAVSVFERVNALVSSLGREETQSAAVLFNDWAMALQRLGRQLEAESLFRRSIDVYRAGQTEEAVPPVILANYASTLRMLGRLGAAADYSERAYAKAQQAGNQFTIFQSLFVRAQVYIDQRDFARAAAMLAELEPILQRTFSPDNQWFGSLASVKALLEMGRGNLPQALVLANQSVSIVEASSKARGQGTDYLPIVLSRRALVNMEAAQPIQAVADANRALPQMQAAAQPGTYSSYTSAHK